MPYSCKKVLGEYPKCAQDEHGEHTNLEDCKEKCVLGQYRDSLRKIQRDADSIGIYLPIKEEFLEEFVNNKEFGNAFIDKFMETPMPYYLWTILRSDTSIITSRMLYEVISDIKYFPIDFINSKFSPLLKMIDENMRFVDNGIVVYALNYIGHKVFAMVNGILKELVYVEPNFSVRMKSIIESDPSIIKNNKYFSSMGYKIIYTADFGPSAQRLLKYDVGLCAGAALLIVTYLVINRRIPAKHILEHIEDIEHDFVYILHIFLFYIYILLTQPAIEAVVLQDYNRMMEYYVPKKKQINFLFRLLNRNNDLRSEKLGDALDNIVFNEYYMPQKPQTLSELTKILFYSDVLANIFEENKDLYDNVVKTLTRPKNELSPEEIQECIDNQDRLADIISVQNAPKIFRKQPITRVVAKEVCTIL